MPTYDYFWRPRCLSVCLLSAVAAGSAATAQVTNFTGAGDGTNWTDAANWNNGEPNGATFDAIIDGAAGSPFDVQLGTTRTVGTLTLGEEDILRVLNAVNFQPTTQIDNAGTLRILSAGSLTDLLIETDVTLTGGGTVELVGANARILDESGFLTGHLTNGNNLIHGQGNIGVNRTQLTNHGTLRADVSGAALVIDPDDRGMVNDGLLEASGMGILKLNAGAYDNLGGTILGGTIRAQADSSVQFVSGPAITNGTLQTVGTGVIETGNATLATLTDITLDGLLRVNNAGNIELAGTFTTNPTSTVLINSSAGSATDLLIETNVTLTGGGTIELAGAGARILDETGFLTGHLTNNDHLIHGQGNIGGNRTQLTNHGTLLADVNAGTLVIDPDDRGMVNDSLMEAANGATLQLVTGAYTNTGGVIRAQTGSNVTLLSGPAITSGTLQTVGTGVIETGNATNSTLTDVTLDGMLRINNADNVELVGTFTTNPTSTVLINSSLGSSTDLLIETNVTLTGGGTVELAGAGARILDESLTADGHLINNDNLIHGRGFIGVNRTQITNHATIRADVSGATLAIDPDIRGMVNDSLLEATNGATLQLIMGAYTNTGGTIRAQTGSNVTLFSGPAITNGTLQTVGTGVIETGSAAVSTLTDVTLDGLLRINNSDNIELVGTFTTNPTSTVLINSTAGSATDLLIESNVTLTGGGTIELAGSGARILDESLTADGHLINNDNLIHGRGFIGVNRTQITNHATIRADVAGTTLAIDPNANGVLNDSLLEATNGATLQLIMGAYTNTGGTIRAQTGSNVTLFSGPAITNGTLQTVGTGVIETGSAAVSTLTDVTLDGLLRINNSDNIELVGTFTTNPTSTVLINSTAGSATDLLIETNVTLTGGGTVELAGAAARILDESGSILGHLTNNDNLIHGRGFIGGNRTQITNHGTIRADVAAQTLVIDTDPRGLANTGTLRAENTATLQIADAFANDGDIVAAASSTVRIDGTMTNNATGTLSGNGLFKMGSTGIGNITNDGEISPGASAGLLTVDAGTIAFGATGSLTAELGGLTAGSDYDRLAVLGNVTLAGTLDASLFGGFTPSVGDSFDILVTSGTLTGTFDTVNLPVAPGEGFSIFYGSNFVRLTVLRIVGDLNGDGFVGIEDLNAVLGHWNQNVTPGDLTLGDPSGDGFVGIEDLNAVLGNWNAGTPFPSAPTLPPTAAAVPEPASGLLLLIALSGFMNRKHR